MNIKIVDLFKYDKKKKKKTDSERHFMEEQKLNPPAVCNTFAAWIIYSC